MRIHLPNFLCSLIRPLTFFCASTVVALGVDAQPYVPHNEDVVVEILPESIVALARELRSPDSPYALSGAARAEIEPLSESELLALQQQALAAYRVAVESGDPRAYGHTLALLELWPTDHQKPALMHILTADVLQHNHGFESALAELRSALAMEPHNAQAHLMKAQINLVIADYSAVRESCHALQTLVRYPVALNCQAQLDGVTGRAEQALAATTGMLQQPGELNPQDHVELNITAAGIAHRLGKVTDAERHYVAALQLSPANGYARVNYAALLLENQRFDDVVSLFDSLPDSAMNPEMQILLAEALLASPSPQSRIRARELIAAIQEVFDVAAMRGEGLPHKEFARFALVLQQRPAEALAAAQENWTLQKEPSDTLLLAQAAQAAGNLEQLTHVFGWTQMHGTQDVRLTTLLSATVTGARAAEEGP